MKKTSALIATLVAWPALSQQTPDRALLDRYCVTCHSQRAKTGGLALEGLNSSAPAAEAETWEKVVRKVRSGMMPPAGMPRPARADLDAFAGRLEAALDLAAARKPAVGFTGMHRLNRTEYANAIRDLLSLDIDVTTLLPTDDSSEGFDNIADALSISPAWVERYSGAAIRISKLALGNLLTTAATATYRAPNDFSQTRHLDGMPLGTRGGLEVRHNFPLDAEYQIKIRSRGAGIGVGGASAPGEELEVLLDGERVKISPTGNIEMRIPVKAGPRTLTATYLRKSPPGAADLWQIYGGFPSVQSIAVIGPLNPSGSGNSPSRRRILVCSPSLPAEETECAKKIVSTLAERAYRGAVSPQDLDTLLTFYKDGRAGGSFDTGIEEALARVLVDPRFVFRLEREPSNIAPGASYRVSDLELASRLSFFVWSSIPDDELLSVARQGKLHEPAILAAQMRRLLADPRASALVTNFGAQWLYLRELKSAKPETPGFTDNLRQAFRRETEMFLESVMREDRSVVDLLNADYTFVDETLAKHYGIPNVRGSRFRRVQLPETTRRGLLGQGSFLLVTSVSNRTSPVARGRWILENILGTAAPLPPPNVPALTENEGAKLPATVRERMELHRSNPACASCHKIMDPIGFSLENYDLTGKWRTRDGNAPIDASGQLVDGTKLDGPESLRAALLARSDIFVQTMAAKLLTFATGRALNYADMPAVRAISAEAARNNNRFSSLILGVVNSPPFQMRTKQPAASELVATGGKQ